MFRKAVATIALVLALGTSAVAATAAPPAKGGGGNGGYTPACFDCWVTR